MITVRRGDEPADLGFRALQLLEDERLQPGAGLPPRPELDSEVLTYVLEGALAVADTEGRQAILHAGEFQRATTGHGVRCRATNPSRSAWAHTVRMWLGPSATGIARGFEQQRFCAAERRGVLRLIASPDAAHGSLRLDQDARVFATLLAPGQHVIHELGVGRGAWLHVLSGEAVLADVILGAGDSAGVAGECGVSVTARVPTEILLFDLA